MRHHGSRHDRPQQLGAGRILQRLQPAAQRIDQAIARRFVGEIALDLVAQRIVGDVREDLIGRRPFIADMRRHTISY